MIGCGCDTADGEAFGVVVLNESLCAPRGFSWRPIPPEHPRSLYSFRALRLALVICLCLLCVPRPRRPRPQPRQAPLILTCISPTVSLRRLSTSPSLSSSLPLCSAPATTNMANLVQALTASGGSESAGTPMSDRIPPADSQASSTTLSGSSGPTFASRAPT